MAAGARGLPVSYLAVPRGAPVESADGVVVGRVARVLSEERLDVFLGIVMRTREGPRVVDRDQIDVLLERGVVLRLRADQCRLLPAPRRRGPAFLRRASATRP